MSIMSHTGKVLLSGDNIATSNYVYNSDGTSDWESARYEKMYVSYCVATLTATDVDLRIEGRFQSTTRPIELYATTLSGAMTIDKYIEVPAVIKEVRVGIKANQTGSPLIHEPNSVYTAVGRTELQ